MLMQSKPHEIVAQQYNGHLRTREHEIPGVCTKNDIPYSERGRRLDAEDDAPHVHVHSPSLSGAEFVTDGDWVVTSPSLAVISPAVMKRLYTPVN